MASVYLDTSALIKLCIEEEGTAALLDLTKALGGGRIIILDLSLIEARSAIRRRERESDISGPDADRILRQIDEDRSSSYLVQPSSSAMIEEAARLLDSHPLRAYDALQLAGCLTVRHGAPAPLTFVCADSRLCQTADFEELAILNPLESG